MHVLLLLLRKLQPCSERALRLSDAKVTALHVAASASAASVRLLNVDSNAVAVPLAVQYGQSQSQLQLLQQLQ
jgi:hypothetical protein